MKTNLSLRWMALAAVMLNVVFNGIYDRVLGLPSMAAISSLHPSLFLPASYAFSIWGVIYIAMIGYCVYQLLPSQRYVPIHDRIALPVIGANLLGIGWIIAFSQQLLLLSVAIIGVILVLSLVMYTRATEGVEKWGYRPLLAVPFSLLAGWISVATIANVSSFLKAQGWNGGMPGEEAWAIAMMGIACLLGIILNYRYRDAVFPLVIIWALIAIWINFRHDNSNIAGSACVISAVVLLWTSIYSLATTRNRMRISHQH